MGMGYIYLLLLCERISVGESICATGKIVSRRAKAAEKDASGPDKNCIWRQLWTKK